MSLDSEDMFKIEPSSDDLTGGFESSDSTNSFCKVCGVELPYGGRGPRRKFCDEHRPNKGASTGKRRTPTNLVGIEQSLADGYRMLAMGISFFNHIDGAEIEAKADVLAHSWVVAAETNPKLLKFLQRATTGSSMGGVIIAHLMVAVPIAMNHGIMDKIKVGK